MAPLTTIPSFQEEDFVFSTTLQRPGIIASVQDSDGDLPCLYLVEYDEPDGRPNCIDHVAHELQLIWREGMTSFNPVVAVPEDGTVEEPSLTPIE